MKAIGEVRYREEIDYRGFGFLHMNPRNLFDIQNQNPVVRVLLHPSENFCPEMAAYGQMEVLPADPDQIIDPDLDVTPYLIEYLYSQGETEIGVLYRMAASINYLPQGGLRADFAAYFQKVRIRINKTSAPADNQGKS